MKYLLLTLFLLNFIFIVKSECVWSLCGEACGNHPYQCNSQSCGFLWRNTQYWCCSNQNCT